MLGRHATEFLPAEVAGRLAAEDRLVQTNQTTLRREESLADARGQTHWFETIKAPLTSADGKPRGTIGIARSLTARKHTEAALRHQRDLGLGLLSVERIGR